MSPVIESRGSASQRGCPVVVSAERRWYVACLSAVVAFYLIAYGWLVVSTDGLPYVLDNNESFSSLMHARNLYYFGVEKSAGLTDEAYGPDPAAHPFVHTHQGNFPRLFAFLIFVLGARSVESQIIVTTFTVGLLAIYLTYHFLALITRPLFALIACLVLLSDYLGYAQWHVVTYRVWHLLLLFGALLCVQSIATMRNRRWVVSMALVYLCLFYFELVFAAFTAIAAGLYTAWVHRRQPLTAVSLWFVQGISAVISLSVLVLQLSSHLGWEVFREDLYLTFFARNGTSNLALQMTKLRSFFEVQNIVFFYNIIDVTEYRSVWKFLELHFLWYFQNDSPLFVLLVLTLVGGWVLGHLQWPSTHGRLALPTFPAPSPERRRAINLDWCLSALDVRVAADIIMRPNRVRSTILRLIQPTATQDPRPEPERQYTISQDWQLWVLDVRVAADIVVRPNRVRSAIFRLIQAVPTLVALTALGAAGVFLATTVLRDNAIFGLEQTIPSFLARTRGLSLLPAGLMGLAAVVLALRFGLQQERRFALRALVRTFLAAIFLVGLSLFIRTHSVLYEPAYRAIWYEAVSLWVPRWVSCLALLVAALLAVSCILGGTRGVLGHRHHLAGLAPYLIVTSLAYVVVYLLSPGYVFSGYLVRGAPLFVFLADILVGLALYTVLASSLQLRSDLASALRSAGVGLQSLRTLPVWGGLNSRLISMESVKLVFTSIVTVKLLAGVASLSLLVFLVGYWVHMQVVYLQILPPQHFAFLKMLADPPYRGASFAVSTYAAPVSAYTGQWAYISPVMAGGEVTLTEDGFVQTPDPDSYVWLADRHSNPSYSRPEYFLCMRGQSWASGLKRLKGQDLDANGCSSLPIIKQADASATRHLSHRVVARDPSPADAWVLVELDWDFPPYLRVLDDNFKPRIESSLDESTVPPSVRVGYQFAHQEGKPESGSILRLVAHDSDGSRCVIAEQRGGERLAVPVGMVGTMYVTVTPHTMTKGGQEYVGSSFEVHADSGQNLLVCSRP